MIRISIESPIRVPRLALLSILWLPALVSAQAPTHRIEATDRQTIAATIAYELQSTDFTVTKWTAFLPEPPELPSQSKVKTTAEPAGKLVLEKSPLARKVRMIEMPIANPMTGANLKIRLDVQATLRSRKLVALKDGEKPPTVAALAAVEKKFYLAPSPRIDFDRAAFKEWLDAKKLRRPPNESPLEFAARVLERIRSDYDYKFDPDEDKRSSVSCSRAALDCGGMAFVFVGAMRANEVPARVLVGRLALPRKPGSTPADPEYDRPHIRTEIYVAGIGWVPIDPAYANRDKHRPSTDALGADPGDMLVLHIELDLKLPLPERAKTADLLQIGPYFWAAGRGKFDAGFGPTGWDVKTTPVAKK